VPRTAIHTPFRGGTVADIARLVVDLAGDGLRRRKYLAAGQDETRFLAPLNETLDLGKTQAERWLDKYNGEWAGDLTRIFDEAEI
jgi:glutamate--cysteine ligase